MEQWRQERVTHQVTASNAFSESCEQGKEAQPCGLNMKAAEGTTYQRI